MNALSLFSGIGGLDVALSDFVRQVIYCEIDPFCQSVLLSRMVDGSLHECPIWDDVGTLSGLPYRGYIDIIYAGFPCQDISIAGNGKGLEGKRSGLFFEIVRLAKEIKPKFIFIENVPAITTRGGLQVVREIAKMGYDCRWCVISASEIGAVHRRQRFFLLAYSHSQPGRQTYQKSESKPLEKKSRIRFTRQDRRTFPFVCWDEGKCPSLAMDNGLPFELEQARSLGNAVVPAQAKKAFEILMGIKNEN